ncbi:hypothetical protein [Granulicella paludicola]|uniref:hypothetical protein n=1 Tax=Granulicella paludicola TaxID=474951 RepID=UPI0021DFFF76|nr:hypothetical protein [Granulicella paludicola]
MSLKTIQKHLAKVDKALAAGDTAQAQSDLLLAMDALGVLLTQEKTPAAVMLGSKGGAVTAKRGSDYFRELAARRKTNAGGRPRKNAE